MAVAAGSDCLANHDRSRVDGIVFASTTPPYAEKQCAAIVAAALDLRNDIFAVDVANVLRAGTNDAAPDCAGCGGFGTCRPGPSARRRQPAGTASRRKLSGHPVTAPPLSSSPTMACWLNTSAATPLPITCSMHGDRPGDPFVRTWEDRFRHRRRHRAHCARCRQRVLPATPASNSVRRRENRPVRSRRPPSRAAGPAVGFCRRTRSRNRCSALVGNTGAAFAPMLLASALETARPGRPAARRILRRRQRRHRVSRHRRPSPARHSPAHGRVRLASQGKRMLGTVTKPTPGGGRYGRWTTLPAVRSAASPSVSALWREGRQERPLYGARCRSLRLRAVPGATGPAWSAARWTTPSRCGSARTPGVRSSPTLWTTSPARSIPRWW